MDHLSRQFLPLSAPPTSAVSGVAAQAALPSLQLAASELVAGGAAAGGGAVGGASGTVFAAPTAAVIINQSARGLLQAAAAPLAVGEPPAAVTPEEPAPVAETPPAVAEPTAAPTAAVSPSPLPPLGATPTPTAAVGVSLTATPAAASATPRPKSDGGASVTPVPTTATPLPSRPSGGGGRGGGGRSPTGPPVQSGPGSPVMPRRRASWRFWPRLPALETVSTGRVDSCLPFILPPLFCKERIFVAAS